MARFNFNSKCAHPRICQRLMAEFLQDATSLTYEVDTRPLTITDDFKLVFGEGEVFTVSRTVKMKRINNVNFCAFVDEDDDEIMEFGYNYKCLADNQHDNFNRIFYLKNRSFMGFSSLTLTLLHELGHFETADKVPNGYCREVAVKAIHKACTDKKGNKDYEKANLMYFSLPDEWLATQWAADWLSDKENRQRAKRFERDFFKAWRGK